MYVGMYMALNPSSLNPDHPKPYNTLNPNMGL